MGERLLVRVLGEPAPQGSKRVFGKHLVESNKNTAPWRATVANAVESALNLMEGGWENDQPFSISLVFVFGLPAKPTKKRLMQFWRTSKPDIDKLQRAILDALTTAGAVKDDSRVVAVMAFKIETQDEPPCVYISMRRANDLDQVRAGMAMKFGELVSLGPTVALELPDDDGCPND